MAKEAKAFTTSRLFDLKGRVSLVTGGAGHLGSSMAWALCEAGAEVVLGGRDPRALTRTEAALRLAGHSASAVAGDISKPSGVEKVVAAVKRRHGRLDVLVNNAYSGPAGVFARARWEDFRAAYEVSVQASFLLIQQALPLLSRAAKDNRGGASVINIASMYGLVSPDPSVYGKSGYDNPPSYGPAKAALLQLTRYAACHLAPRGIRVNSISPGAFPPPSIARAQPALFRKLCGKSPMSRLGRAEEMKGPVVFLASDASSFVTGTNLVVDGGWTAW